MTTPDRDWLTRCWCPAVILPDGGVVFRGQLRTSRYAWDEIEAATLVRLRAASPLNGLLPILLVAGDKSGYWRQWYGLANPRAEQLLEIYLKERAQEEGEER